MNTKTLRKTIQLTKATLFFTLILSTTLLFTKAITWSSDIQITDDSAFDKGPSIIQAADGSIWVAWASDRTGQYDIYYKNSSNYELSLTTPLHTLTTNSSDDQSPCIMQTANGSIWVVWVSNREGSDDLFCKTSHNYGQSWSDVIRLTDDTSFEWNPCIMEDSDGTIWLFWASNKYGTFDLFYKTSTNFGNSWSNEVQLPLTDGSYTDFTPSVIETWNGTIWVVWTSDRNGNYDLFYKTSLDHGESWSGDVPLVTDLSFDSMPSIIEGLDGAIWVFWGTDRNSGKYDIYYITSPDHGSTWSPEATGQVTTNPNGDTNPSATNTDENRIWIVFQSDRTTNYDLFYTRSDVILIHDVAVTNVVPSMSVAMQGDMIPVDVLVENQGDEAEAFDVELYANSSLVDSEWVSLASGSSTMLSFSWDTTDFPGRYVLSATATAVPGEAGPNLEDNTFVDGTVRVNFLGDVDGDGDVDLADFAMMLWAYDTTVGDDLYNPNADFDNDGDVDLADFFWVIFNYGAKI